VRVIESHPIPAKRDRTRADQWYAVQHYTGDGLTATEERFAGRREAEAWAAALVEAGAAVAYVWEAGRIVEWFDWRKMEGRA